MALPASPNSISMNQVNVELGFAGTTTKDLNNSAVRSLASKPTNLSTISMDDLRGKSAAQPFSISPDHDTGNNYDSELQGGTINTFPSVFITGGSAPFSFLWSFIDNTGGYSINNTAIQSPTVSRTYVKMSQNEFNATLNVRVTDGFGQVRNATVFVSATTGIGY